MIGKNKHRKNGILFFKASARVKNVTFLARAKNAEFAVSTLFFLFFYLLD
jgi:hypothetical protein